jgi:hypothetical protein
MDRRGALAVGEGTPVDASINVEVFSDTSDRFGGKIAAVMYRPLVAESAPLVEWLSTGVGRRIARTWRRRPC